MNYKSISNYEGDMSASDLCDAIVEARTCDLPEIRTAMHLLIEDLQLALLNAENLYYLVSDVTDAPHINEHFAVYLFDDRYYAEKFVEKNKVLKLNIHDAAPEDYEWLFSHFYNCGAECVDYCNDNSNVTFDLEHYFLSDNYDKTVAPGRLLSRFTNLCMQEIRNDDKQYERKPEIVTLLKKNIISESLTTNIFIPAFDDGNLASNVSLDKVNVRIATMSTSNKELFFPVYTARDEFKFTALDGIKLVETTLLSYIEFVEKIAKNNEHVFGLAINPESVNFAMNRGILDIVLQNKNAVTNKNKAN